MAIIFLVTVVLQGGALAKTLTAESLTIPCKQEGLFVDAICGIGCESLSQSCNVYILTEKEYQNYKKNDSKIQSKGKTPLFIQDLSPGIYYVAIDAPVNTSKVPMTGGVYPNPLKPDYQKFFIDDLPVFAQHVLSTDPVPEVINGQTMFRVVNTFRKWYKISVVNDVVTPVVAIYLNKQSSLGDWAKFYPKKDRFKIVTDSNFQKKFVDAVERNSGTSIQDKNLFFSLLHRGGRVNVPNSNTTTVVSINSKGLLQAKSIISQYSILDSPEKVSSISPNQLISTKSNSESANNFPKYETELKGSNEVRIVNPNKFSVVAGLRSYNKGLDFNIPAKSTQSTYVPDGNYSIYFNYSYEPEALYKSESFTLKQNGVEIQIVKVAGGNYAIRRVK